MSLFRPEYLFNPLQLARRIGYFLRTNNNRSEAKTPWGMVICFAAAEAHGRAMMTFGLSDLRTNEMISRIINEGDIAVDVGANIGIMTSLMAKRAGRAGRVFAFEPHPATRENLTRNVSRWEGDHTAVAPVAILSFALSSERGPAALIEPTNFESNSGIAQLSRGTIQSDIGAHPVETLTFDDFAVNLKHVRLVKIDVEGWEDDVLAGMAESLSAGLIDFIIFEEMRALPSPACIFLSEFGYKSYLIDRNLFGPVLVPVEDAPPTLVGEATNILAVRTNRNIDLQFLTRRGWTCLRDRSA